jgi:lipopolysaccharide transport system ATP-binding protein
MSVPIIHVNNISKIYRLGSREQVNKTFREAIIDILKAPFKNFRDLKKLTKFKDENDRASLKSPRQPEDIIWALKDISFKVEPGEILGIIGKNGAGKSTLLKILSRITEPTSGDIMLHGRVSSLLEVGTGFHPELTGRENIYLNGTILGMRKSEIDKKFDDIVAFSEIEKFLDTPVKRYSSGMYVRLAFAVAAHLEPEILIVDEVLAVGDAAFQKKCLGKMGDVAREGRTILFVSHNMQAIKNLCSYGILLDQGKITYSGPAVNTVDHYLQNSTFNVPADNISSFISSLPEDHVFKYKDLSITQDGIPIQIVDNSKPLQITINYEVFQRTKGLRVYFDLCDTDGLIILRSFNDEDNDEIPTVEPGKFKTTATIPADFLSPTAYQLIIRATIFNVRTFEPKEGILVQFLVERLGRTNKAYPTEPLRGKISPYINWITISDNA